MISCSDYSRLKAKKIEDNEGWFYFTEIGLGTPPQKFKAAVDIGWSDMLVPSSLCIERSCTDHALYNHSQSTSYHSNGTEVKMHYTGFYSSGFASIDALHVSNILITNQTFEEATILKPVYLWDDIFDSSLGLSRLQVNDAESSLRAKSPFWNMIQQRLLPRNMFSLRLSETSRNISGELLFGAMNKELFIESSLRTFNVSTASSNERVASIYLEPGWQVSAHSISHIYTSSSGSQVISNASLDGYVAAFSTVFPYISLPKEIGKPILKYLGADLLNRVDCSKRDEMPSLVITLGGKHEVASFVMEPEDYIRREPMFELEFRGDKCQVEIAAHENPEDGAEYIVLGSVFLARWYSVFDFDNGQVSRKFISGLDVLVN